MIGCTTLYSHPGLATRSWPRFAWRSRRLRFGGCCVGSCPASVGPCGFDGQLFFVAEI